LGQRNYQADGEVAVPVFDFTIGAVRDFTPEEAAVTEAQRLAIAPDPVEQRAAAGYATVTSAAVSSVDGYGFGSATRVALGRLRFYFSDPQPDTGYFAQVTVRHTADVMVRVSAKTTSYVEVKTNNIEALEYGVTVTRIIR
jgi:hypothetical protein